MSCNKPLGVFEKVIEPIEGMPETQEECFGCQFNKLPKDKNELKQGLQGIQNKNSITTSKKLIGGV
jgi:hypothetical protein